MNYGHFWRRQLRDSPIIKWFRRKRNRRLRPVYQSFQKSRNDGALIEYRGCLPACYRGRNEPIAIHTISCFRITREQGELLSRERSIEPIGSGKVLSHSIVCTAKISAPINKTRILFVVHLAIDNIRNDRVISSSLLSDTVAIQLTKYLAKRLIEAPLHVVIRCDRRNQNEYPWCLDDRIFNGDWELQIGVFYRLILRELEKHNIV